MKPSISFLNMGIALAIAASSTACMESALKNGDFDDWCGDKLCLWETDEGSIEKVPTWHREDFGVSFIADPTIISQRVENGSTKCFLFTITADVAKDAALYFELDYLDDDVFHPDFSQKVEAPDWNKVKFDVAVPSWCDEFRVILRKTGKGEAVAAAIDDEQYEECPLTIPDDERPVGIPCETDDQCLSSLCDGVCQ